MGVYGTDKSMKDTPQCNQQVDRFLERTKQLFALFGSLDRGYICNKEECEVSAVVSGCENRQPTLTLLVALRTKPMVGHGARR